MIFQYVEYTLIWAAQNRRYVTLHFIGYFGFSKIDTKNLNFYCRLGNGVPSKPVQAAAAFRQTPQSVAGDS